MYERKIGPLAVAVDGAGAEESLCLLKWHDGCESSILVSHGLKCKKGGLFLLHHNTIRIELTSSLASQARTPSAVRNKHPLIQPSRGMESAPLTQGNACLMIVVPSSSRDFGSPALTASSMFALRMLAASCNVAWIQKRYVLATYPAMK